MTTNQKRKVLIKIQSLEKDIETLKDVRVKLATSEFVSASLSSGGGSRSYTRQGIGQLNETISQLVKELQSYRNMLNSDGSNPLILKSILHVYW